MKRNMDLIREVLLKVEEVIQRPHAVYVVYPGDDFSIDGFNADEIAYHLDLTIDAGLVEGKFGADGHVILKKLTWQGCEFLDDVRNPEIWGNTKKRAQKAASFGLDILKEIAKSEIRKAVGLP